MAEHGVRVGYRWFRSAAVADWSGNGTGAFRTDAQRAAFIEARDRSAAGAYGVNFQHGHSDGLTGDHGFAGGAQFAGEQRDIRRRAAHVEADAFFDSCQFWRRMTRR